MNSTNDIESKIKALFEGVVLKNSAENYLSTFIDKNTTSYYEEPKHPGHAYYSFIDTDSADSFTSYLKDFWLALNTEEFTVMAAEISELAFLLTTDVQT